MGARAALRAAGHPSVTAVAALAAWLPPSRARRRSWPGAPSCSRTAPATASPIPARSLEFARRARSTAARLCRFELQHSGHAMLQRLPLWQSLTRRFVLGALGLEPMDDAPGRGVRPAARAGAASAAVTAVRVAVVGSGVAGLTAAHIIAPHARGHPVRARRSPRRARQHDRGRHGRRPRGRPRHRLHRPQRAHLPDAAAPLRRSRHRAPRTATCRFGVRCEGCGLEYAGARGMQGVVPRPGVLGRPRYLRMLTEVKRFHRQARAVLADPAADGLTLDGFLRQGGYSPYFADHFMLPLTGAVWSSSPSTIRDFPARYLLRFLANHGMLTVKNSPQWRTVTGGSREYVARIADGPRRPRARRHAGRVDRPRRRRGDRERRAPLRPRRDRRAPRPGPADARRAHRRRAVGAGRVCVLVQPDRAAHRRVAAAARGRRPRLVELPARRLLDQPAARARHLPPEPPAGAARAGRLLRHAQPDRRASAPATSCAG